jgi:hypothetical protein
MRQAPSGRDPIDQPPPHRPHDERDHELPRRDAVRRHPSVDDEHRDHGRRPHGPRSHEAPHSERRPEPRREHRDARGPEGGRHDTQRPHTQRPHTQPHETRPHETQRPERPAERAPHAGVTRGGPRPAPPARSAPAGRVALLVDLAALLAEARTLGAELSQHKLRNGIANHRAVVRAVAVSPTGTPVPGGFDAIAPDTSFGGGVQFAATAFELLAAAGHLVLAPATAANVQLAQALRRAGHQVELAGLAAAATGDEPVRRLGRDCLFVP